MIYFTEEETFERILADFQDKAKEKFEFNIKIKKKKISNPIATELYREYKNGESSSKVDIDFVLEGWKSYSEDGLKDIITEIIEGNDEYLHLTDFEIFELQNKGRLNVKISGDFVYTRMDIMGETISEKDSTVDKDEIKREIELRLSEIYSLLKKL